MKLTRVTMTGADNSVNPLSLAEISQRFPFVEWGILLSRSQEGYSRFPRRSWMNMIDENPKINYSGHLCGGYVREFLMGDIDFMQHIPIYSVFKRIQINTHGVVHKYDLKKLVTTLHIMETQEHIFQYDNVNSDILLGVLEAFDKANVSTLFDLSHGAGVLPEHWPVTLNGVKCGYAGGLSPDNVVAQLEKIKTVVPEGTEIWIDAETHLRSDDDQQFDVQKVIKFLEACQPYIS